MRLHAEVLRKNGRKEFVILPYEEFVAVQELLEDVRDLRALRRAKLRELRAPSLSLRRVRVELGIDKR